MLRTAIILVLGAALAPPAAGLDPVGRGDQYAPVVATDPGSLRVWHEADPPGDFERRRNDVVASFQGNRNPFVDHPEWVACLHLGECAVAGDALFADGFDAAP